ncbi:GATA zinc finger domain-containing protein 1-like protein [Leptotrombidium deliense]|uniref:GATA zinc finger domain-containing protein 1-like protein n=1 Tax=Leptotrombidium deliense TaxID=299467 RepID=A0A443SQD2_9ACAR|nr:GATA zinc finger domain-containing protein 1-like protein [Leptotrombidium deliense]
MATKATRVLSKGGKGRRSIFKKCVYKSPPSIVSPVCSSYLFYRGVYWQKGDIVSVRDENGDIYFAQIRGFLQDQYCEKSAVLTWLLPTQASNRECFEPWTYILGPEEDYPRKLDAMTFICHAPHDYFAPEKSSFRLSKANHGFISTILPSVDINTNNEDTI